MDNAEMRELVAIVKAHLATTEKMHRTLAGIQYALLGIVGGISNPDEMVSSLEMVKAAALPQVDSSETVLSLKIAVVEQLDMLIEHIADTRRVKDGAP